MAEKEGERSHPVWFVKTPNWGRQKDLWSIPGITKTVKTEK